MRVPATAGRGRLQFNMTPMIDVVFLLIIFFIVSSHLARQETQLELALPAARSGHQAGLDDTRRVTVNVLPDGQLLLGGGRVAAEELLPKIQYEGRQSAGDLEVRIRSDRTVPYRFVEPILVACARAGIWNVTFAVIPRQDP